MPDRSKRPEFKLTKNIQIPDIQKINLDNEIPFIYINGGQEEIIKIILNFRAGSWVQTKRLVSSTTTQMLTEGTKNKTSTEISEIISFYGADINLKSGYHNNYIILTVLNKHLEPLLELLQQMLLEPSFPEDEMRTLLNNQKQEYLIEMENIETIARYSFQEAVFGYNHPYGTYAKPQDFDLVQRQDLIDFFNKYFIKNNLRIVAGGKVTDREITLINKYITNIKSANPQPEPEYDFQPAEQKNIYKPKDNSLQSAIMIGNKTINIHHPDFLPLHFVTTLLGGYFGSRLMSNIREEKGLTYGIWASLETYLYSGLLSIEASVRKENKDTVIKEIKNEIHKLKLKGADQEEILTVKNYMLSQLLNLINGIFPLTSYVNSIYNAGLDERHINHYINTINSIDNQKITEIANQYLHFDDFYQIIAG